MGRVSDIEGVSAPLAICQTAAPFDGAVTEVTFTLRALEPDAAGVQEVRAPRTSETRPLLGCPEWPSLPPAIPWGEKEAQKSKTNIDNHGLTYN